MTEVSEIRINYQQNPIGIENVEQIGWKITSDFRNVVQKSYEIQIAEDEKFEVLLYDSKVVESEESAHIRGAEINEKLTSSKKYFIRVRVSTWYGGSENTVITEWKTGFFVTALCSKQEWNAEFITIETNEDWKESKGSYLRKEIKLIKPVKAAYAYTTALGLYHFYVNGDKQGEDEFTPGWTSYNKHLLYQIYDVTNSLKMGTNTVASMLGAGWYKGDMGFVRMRNHYGKRTAFLCQIAVQYEDGTKEIFCTDESWKGTYGPILFSEIYDGEFYDARQEIEGWNETGCDDSSWMTVSEVPFDKNVLKAQSGSKVRQITEVPAKKIFKTPQGDTVIDFGQNMTGWITFRVKGYAGAKVVLNCFEVLDAEGNVYLDNLRSAKEMVTYICKDEKEVIFHENFSFQGFQYARINAYPGIPKIEDFTAYAVHSDMEPTGSFRCSNSEINQLHHNIVWGMKGNFLDVPTDCPQRDERLGWTGDAQIFCRTATYLMDTYTFYRKWLADVAADQTADGGIPHVVPDILIGKSSEDRLMKDGEHSAAAWADVDIIMPWTLYLMYGDTKVIEEQYESMKEWIRFMQEHSQENIWNYKLQFGDWVALDAEEGSYFGATPNDLTCTAYYAYSTRLFYQMAEVIGRHDDAKKYRMLYEKIKKTYQAAFFENGRLRVQTQTAQIVSLYFNLVPDECRENVIQDLIELLRKEDGHLVTGFVGTPYFCHALSQNGHTKEAYELLLKDDFPSWLYQVKQGATTVWEHWDGKKPDGTMWSADMNSFNHYAYGAVAEWLYRVVAGLEVSEQKPGFKEIIIEPHIGGNLTYAVGQYNSIYGKICSKWEIEDGKVLLTVEIPCNTRAVIHLYKAVEILDSAGICFDKNDFGFEGRIGSGVYKIMYRIED